jgi:hypothetical protein
MINITISYKQGCACFDVLLLLLQVLLAHPALPALCRLFHPAPTTLAHQQQQQQACQVSA